MDQRKKEIHETNGRSAGNHYEDRAETSELIWRREQWWEYLSKQEKLMKEEEDDQEKTLLKKLVGHNGEKS